MANERTGQPIPFNFFYFAIARAGFVLIWKLPTAAPAVQRTRAREKDGND
jgi:hypothetical protein